MAAFEDWNDMFLEWNAYSSELSKAVVFVSIEFKISDYLKTQIYFPKYALISAIRSC